MTENTDDRLTQLRRDYAALWDAQSEAQNERERLLGDAEETCDLADAEDRLQDADDALARWEAGDAGQAFLALGGEFNAV